MRLLLLALPLLALLMPSAAAGNVQYVLQIDMYGERVVPPVETQAWGFVRFFFNEDRSEADYTLDVKGVSNSAVTGVTIREGAASENGEVVLTLSDGDFIVTGGHLSLTPEEQAVFASGAWYLTLTTVANPEGELRGQIVVPADFFTSTSGGAAYPPPSKAPPVEPVVAVPPPGAEPTPPAGGGASAGAGGGGSGGGGSGGSPGGGLIQPPNTGSGGLR